jgi:PAS domain S-box-containing protein
MGVRGCCGFCRRVPSSGMPDHRQGMHMWRAAAKIAGTLYGRITLGVVIVILSTVLVNLMVVRTQVDLVMRRAQSEHASNLLQSTVANVEAQFRGLLFHKQTAMDMRKKETRDVVEFAVALARDYHARASRGDMSLAEAQAAVLDVLRAFRYDNGTGYIWVNNVDRPLPRIVMHPILPELDGVVVDDPQYYTAYGRPIHLFKAFVDVCLEHGSGYVDYLWPKPTGDGVGSLQMKLSYVELFPAWEWVIGSGLYIDDIEAEAQRKIAGIVRDLNETLGSLSIGNAGYLLIFDGQDRLLVHPSMAGRSLRELMESTTNRPMSELLREAALRPDRTFSYTWDRPGDEGHFVHRKRAYVAYYQPLDWYIATTVYEEDEVAPSARLQRNLLFLGSLVMSLALVLCLLLVRSIVRPMTRLSLAAERIGREGLDAASIPMGGTEEVRRLGEVLTKMITSIRISQRKLLESEGKYRSMMEAMDDMVIICSPDGVIEYANPSVTRFLGRDVSGMVCTEALGECGGFCVDSDVTSSGGTSFRLVRLERERHFHVTTCPVDHSDGTKSSMSIIRDVSVQARAEAQLLGAQQHIQNIINSMPSMVIGLDWSGRISLWNKESEQVLGLPQERVRGEYITVLPEEFTFLQDMYRSSMESAQVVKRNKLVLQLGGEKVFCDVTVYPLDDEGGAVIRIDDVSDLVRLEEIMIQSEKMSSLGGLAAGMAHEINNPLAGIVQNAQVIRHRLSGELRADIDASDACSTTLEAVNCYLERRRILSMVDMILDSGVRAARIVGNMLSFVRKSGDEKRPEDLAVLLDKTVELATNDYDLKKKYDFRQIEIVREYAEDVPKVLCEAGKIQQVFMNLLKNGAQAMAEIPDRPSRFILRIGREGDGVRVEIEDNGTGLSDAVRKRIFEPFFTTKPIGSGTGLGLSVSYFIVTEHHGGSMRVETIPGRMANFIMYFSAGYGDAAKGTPAPPAAQG